MCCNCHRDEMHFTTGFLVCVSHAFVVLDCWGLTCLSMGSCSLMHRWDPGPISDMVVPMAWFSCCCWSFSSVLIKMLIFKWSVTSKFNDLNEKNQHVRQYISKLTEYICLSYSHRLHNHRGFERLGFLCVYLLLVRAPQGWCAVQLQAVCSFLLGPECFFWWLEVCALLGP